MSKLSPYCHRCSQKLPLLRVFHVYHFCRRTTLRNQFISHGYLLQDFRIFACGHVICKLMLLRIKKKSMAKYFFAKCVVAIVDSQSRGRLGRDKNSTEGVVNRPLLPKSNDDGSANYRQCNLRSLTRRLHCTLTLCESRN